MRELWRGVVHRFRMEIRRRRQLRQMFARRRRGWRGVEAGRGGKAGMAGGWHRRLCFMRCRDSPGMAGERLM